MGVVRAFDGAWLPLVCLKKNMRKVILATLLVAFIVCTIALPVSAAMPVGSSHCSSLSEGFYVGLQTGIPAFLALLALLMVAGYGMVGIVGTAVPSSVVRLVRTMQSWIPPPVLLAAAAVDDPQVYDRGAMAAWFASA